MALSENFVDDRPSKFARFRNSKIQAEKVDSLDSVIETPVSEGRKMFLDHFVHSFNKNSIFSLEEFVARVSPLLDRLVYQFFGHEERIVIREFSCLGPTFRMSLISRKKEEISLTAAPSS